MRARSLKPGFFKNEYLAELGPYAQLLFEGLWCLADREGKLEDRPKRIKAEIFPYYDPKPDVETLLCKLQEAGFISRYSVNGFKLIKVLNFTKHQSPHSTEKPSIYPDPPQNSERLSLINESASVNSRKHNALTTDSPTPDSLTPDSLTGYSGGEALEKTNLNPKREVPPRAEADASAFAGQAEPPGGSHPQGVFVKGGKGNGNGRKAPRPSPLAVSYPEDFLRFWEAYPRKTGKREALRRWLALKKDGALPDLTTLLGALKWQKEQESWREDGGKFVPHPATWLNAGRWDDEPPVQSNASIRASPPRADPNCPRCEGVGIEIVKEGGRTFGRPCACRKESTHHQVH